MSDPYCSAGFLGHRPFGVYTCVCMYSSVSGIHVKAPYHPQHAVSHAGQLAVANQGGKKSATFSSIVLELPLSDFRLFGAFGSPLALLSLDIT